MDTVNIHEAKTHLSKLIEKAVKGDSFIIAKAGKPMVKVTAVGVTDRPKPRVGFLKGHIKVPADFDSIGKEEVEGLFEGR